MLNNCACSRCQQVDTDKNRTTEFTLRFLQVKDTTVVDLHELDSTEDLIAITIWFKVTIQINSDHENLQTTLGRGPAKPNPAYIQGMKFMLKAFDI